MNLLSHLDSTDFDVQQRLNGLKASFVAKGMTPDTAMNEAYNIGNKTGNRTFLYGCISLSGDCLFSLYSFYSVCKRKKSKEKNRS